MRRCGGPVPFDRPVQVSDCPRLRVSALWVARNQVRMEVRGPLAEHHHIDARHARGVAHRSHRCLKHGTELTRLVRGEVRW